MFESFRHEDAALDEAIHSALQDLKSFNADEEGYKQATDQLVKLYKIKSEAEKLSLEAATAHANHELEREKADHQKKLDDRPFYARVDPATVIIAASNLYLGLRMLKFERANVFTSKALHFMPKH